MQIVKRLAMVSLILLIPTMGVSSLEKAKPQSIKNKMIHELDIIKNTFDVKYAPAEWKKQFMNWDLEEQIALAKIQVESCPNIGLKEFRQILQDFFNSTQDYHVGVQFYLTAASQLPFRVQSAQGKYYIVWVDKQLAAAEIGVGDQLLKFNDQPVEQIVTDLKRFKGVESKSDQALAEMVLTMRLGMLGHETPSGKATITVKHRTSGEIKTHQLTWDHTPEELQNGPLHIATMGVTDYAAKQALDKHTFFHKQMTAYFYDALESHYAKKPEAQESEAGQQLLGSRKGPLPPLGEIVWKGRAKNHFHAYIFKTPDQHRVGYVRIASYMGGEEEAAQFANLIKFFNTETEALVIDQLDNPGGIVFFMYALATHLSPTPLKMPVERVTITQEDVFYALQNIQEFEDVLSEDALDELDLGATIFGYPVDSHLVQSIVNHFRFIVSEWNEGRSFTNNAYLYGIDELHVDNYAYTKPILMLINEMDFSCADALPAMLQDNKRAILFGTRTAGAGGCVLGHSHPNRFGIASYSFTGSIVERLDKTPIENLGVTPDISYELTERDLQENYIDYVANVHKALSTLWKEAKPAKMPPQEKAPILPRRPPLKRARTIP
jgi:hypothetical protein